MMNSDFIHAHTNCSAVMPLYLTNPITEKGEAPRTMKKVQNKSSILVCTFFDLCVIMKNQMTG